MPSLSEFAEDLFGGEDTLLRTMREEADRQGLPSIQVPAEVGRLLQLLLRSIEARSVLEVGTLFGYSTVFMGRVLPADGRIITLEVNPQHARLAQENLRNAGLADRVEVREGPALESLNALAGNSFDFVFIDADKQTYPQYLQHALQVTRIGGLIVADNVWRDGSVLTPEVDDNARGAADFLKALASEPRLLSSIISTRDGGDALSVSLLLPDVPNA